MSKICFHITRAATTFLSLNLRQNSLAFLFRSQGEKVQNSFCGPRALNEEAFLLCFSRLGSFAPGTLMNYLSPLHGFIKEISSVKELH